eukprot:1095_1
MQGIDLIDANFLKMVVRLFHSTAISFQLNIEDSSSEESFDDKYKPIIPTPTMQYIENSLFVPLKNNDHVLYLSCKSINKCGHTKRILDILSEYQFINNDDESAVIALCTQQYDSLVNDYIHLLEVHNSESDLDKILNLITDEYNFAECNLNNCALAVRCYRDRDDNKKPNTDYDAAFIFYQDILDQIHCFLFHLYDVGLRVKAKNLQVMENTDIVENKKWIDHAFANVCDIINDKKKQLQNMSGFSQRMSNTNKFTIGGDKMEETFMDGLLKFMQQNSNLSESDIKTLQSMFDEEEYESDAVNLDLRNDIKQSNIAILNKSFYNLTKQYVHLSKLHSNTFSIGYRFYYWNYYAKRDDTANLFILRKYTNIKDETINP